MTIIGAGGVIIRRIAFTRRFQKERRKLDPKIRERLDQKICDLLKNPRPPGLRFEKLKGYDDPPIYTIHITGNFKLSFRIEGDCAVLRRVEQPKNGRIDHNSTPFGLGQDGRMISLPASGSQTSTPGLARRISSKPRLKWRARSGRVSPSSILIL